MLSYSALLSRRAGTAARVAGVPRRLELPDRPDPGDDRVAGLGRRLPLRLRRRHRLRLELLEDELPAREVLGHRLGGREGAQVEVALGLILAVAPEAVGFEERADLARKRASTWSAAALGRASDAGAELSVINRSCLGATSMNTSL